MSFNQQQNNSCIFSCFWDMNIKIIKCCIVGALPFYTFLIYGIFLEQISLKTWKALTNISHWKSSLQIQIQTTIFSPRARKLISWLWNSYSIKIKWNWKEFYCENYKEQQDNKWKIKNWSCPICLCELLTSVIEVCTHCN